VAGGDLRAGAGEPPNGSSSLGKGYVWTTFSRAKNEKGEEETRQVDLNFKNPELFLEVLDILLFYAENSASFIRLDAIGYIWKCFGSSSLHEPEAHMLIRALNFLLHKACGEAVLTIAEVNEPQDKAFTYLGTEEYVECDLVYQFTHFPLAIYSLLKGNATAYRDWLPTTEQAAGRQFVTVLGSHDGIGMKPVRGILPESEIEEMVRVLVDEHGGLPNYAILPGGKKIVYEICSTPWQLINNLQEEESFEVRLRRYLAVVHLGLLVRGMPAIYFNGLIGAKNYAPVGGLDENRTANRERFDLCELQLALSGRDSEMTSVFQELKALFTWREAQPAFRAVRQPVETFDTESQSVLFARIPGEESRDDLFLVQNLSDVEQSVGDIVDRSQFRNGKPERVSPESEWDMASILLPSYGAIWFQKSG
jgi:sucrose phosphorylase